MTLPTLVLVHGGQHAADCWDQTVGEIVIVGHSLAGLTGPGVVAELGSSRVREMVLAAAFVPPQGAAVVDTLPGPIGRYTRRNAHKRISGTLPTALAEFVFCNGMTRLAAQVQPRPVLPGVVVDHLRQGRPVRPSDDVPRTWILTLRDRALSVASQHRSIAALGGVHTMLPMDTCHNLMVSEPELLAELLVERCRLYL